MTDIIIYTTPEKLLHKQDKLKDDKDKSDCGEYFWGLRWLPKTLREGGRIYFAVKGFIVGYFKVYYIEEMLDDSCDIFFHSKTWKDIKPIPTKSFQGFKYADKVPEFSNE